MATKSRILQHLEAAEQTLDPEVIHDHVKRAAEIERDMVVNRANAVFPVVMQQIDSTSDQVRRLIREIAALTGLDVTDQIEKALPHLSEVRDRVHAAWSAAVTEEDDR